MHRRLLSPAAALATTLAAAPALAQDLTITRPPGNEPFAVVGATVHTISGDTLENGWVLIEGGRISALGTGEPDIPEGTTASPGTGMHLYPGMIDAVTRLGLVEVSAVRATRDFDEVGDFTPEVHAAVSVNPDSTIIPVARTGGITLAGVFPEGGLVPGRASVIRTDGWTYEDMTAEHQAGLIINWPRARPVQAWWTITNDEEQRKRIRARRDLLDRFFDDAADYHAAHRADAVSASTLARDLRMEAVGPFLPGPGGESPERPLLIRAADVDQITDAVTWAVERGMRPVIVGGRDAALCADLLIAHDVAVIVEGTIGFPKRDDAPYDHAFTLPARLESAGVSWCLSAGDGIGNERNLPHNAGIAVAHGLSREAAARAITLSAAEILGVADRYGSIDVGKSATLILTDGPIHEVTTRVVGVMIDGAIVDNTNKQTALAAKYRAKYRQLGVIREENEDDRGRD
ncbi:MAG: amidohydrolase family protein [Planctomycetota bacterium]